MNGPGERIAALRALAARLRREYADDPNVRSVGWGSRLTGGAMQNELAVVFYVRRKLGSPRAMQAAGTRPIPAEVDGFPTDVVEDNPAPASAGQRDEKEFDPLVGGVTSSNAEGHAFWFNSAGTLGLLVRDAVDNAPMALSNWHVWAEDGDKGDRIIQPGHPTGGDHVEGVTKVLACGPLLTPLIEWEAPSPLAAGLYGGAAAAALASSLSDYRDPMRRGQDATPTEPGELTLRETVDVAIEYPQLPLPGRPFRTQVRWSYARETTERLLAHQVEEERVNAQFLLGKTVVTDRAAYRPGERVTLTAAIWDYQPRPCDAYHVVAHLIPHARPDTALRVVLHPSACPSHLPPFPPEDGPGAQTCVDFGDVAPGAHPYKGAFAWLGYQNPAQEPVQVVDWLQGTPGVAIPITTLRLMHAPATRVIARVAQFTDAPVSLFPFNALGHAVGDATAPNQQGVVHELAVSGEGIVGAVLRGGGGEGVLVSYCIEGAGAPTFSPTVGTRVAAGIEAELPSLRVAGRLQAHRCCFTGSIALPPVETPGKWDVHLVVQNVNHVPPGTPAEQAATVIGGHVLSAHTAPDAVSCMVTMLLDHAFDVI